MRPQYFNIMESLPFEVLAHIFEYCDTTADYCAWSRVSCEWATLCRRHARPRIMEKLLLCEARHMMPRIGEGSRRSIAKERAYFYFSGEAGRACEIQIRMEHAWESVFFMTWSPALAIRWAGVAGCVRYTAELMCDEAYNFASRLPMAANVGYLNLCHLLQQQSPNGRVLGVVPLEIGVPFLLLLERHASPF